MLSETRRLIMKPSSNLAQSESYAWLFLLPRHGRVVCLGSPDRSLRQVIDDMGMELTVLNPPEQLPFPDGVDAVIVATTSDDWAQSVLELNRANLTSDCAVVKLAGSGRPGTDGPWITLDQRMRSVTARRARRLGTLTVARITSQLGMKVPRAVRSHASDVGFIEIPADLATRSHPAMTSISIANGQLPHYLKEIGDGYATPFDTEHWAFGPPRGFASQKVIARLRRSDRSGEVIVKFTQARIFNHRLHAEANALRTLGALDDRAFTLPDLLFESEYAGRLLVGQSAIAGYAYRDFADSDPAGPVASAGFRAIGNLATLTMRESSSRDCADGLSRLLEDFIETFDPPSGAVAALHEVLERLSDVDLPTVFMHGDLGAWNILVGPDQSIGILDWENADSQGVPLWDLFVFARTLGVFLADATGVRYTPAVFERQFLSETRFRRVVFGEIRQYLRQIDLPTEAVDDLFVMCWVQQAVREAASLVAPKWLASRSTQLLARALQTPLRFHG